MALDRIPDPALRARIAALDFSRVQPPVRTRTAPLELAGWVCERCAVLCFVLRVHSFEGDCGLW
jgi:hypothetical protein